MSRRTKNGLMASKEYVKHIFFKVIYLHTVHLLSPERLTVPSNFQKKGPDRISIFRGKFLEEGVTFLSWGKEGSQLLHKK